jgi:ABC-type amino acid transport system permease subunit
MADLSVVRALTHHLAISFRQDVTICAGAYLAESRRSGSNSITAVTGAYCGTALGPKIT